VGGWLDVCVCSHICQQCTFMDCTSHLTYNFIIVDICHCNLIKIRWIFVFALFCLFLVCCFGVTPSSNDIPYGVQNS
jgi:hypothetical protein